MERLNKESGQALILVLMVVLVLFLIGTAAVTRASDVRSRQFDEVRMAQSLYIAEAGAEKALAQVRNNYSWLKGLPYNKDVSYISSLNYAGGRIDYVKVRRTSSGANPTKFKIMSKGYYQGATRTIEVEGEMYDPLPFDRGIWLMADIKLGNNTLLNTDLTVEGDVDFKNNSRATGNIASTGTVTAENSMDAASIVAAADVVLTNMARVNANISAGRDIRLDIGCQIGGDANAVRDLYLPIEISLNVDDLINSLVTLITGDINYNGQVHILGGILDPILRLIPNILQIVQGLIEGIIPPGDAAPVSVDLPPDPVIEESLYSQSADRVLGSTLSGNFNVDGISYAPGNLRISGSYSGEGIIVAHGKVTVDGDLLRADDGASLCIITFGDVGGVGIEVTRDVDVYAMLFTPKKIILNDGVDLHGSLIADILDTGNNVAVTLDLSLFGRQPKWTTTTVKIKSWKESNLVF